MSTGAGQNIPKSVDASKQPSFILSLLAFRLRYNNPQDNVNQYPWKRNTQDGHQHINDAHDGWVNLKIFAQPTANAGYHTFFPGPPQSFHLNLLYVFEVLSNSYDIEPLKGSLFKHLNP